MVDQPQQTDLLVRYLLSELSETEQERLEEKYFNDDELLLELLAVEDQLIDDYLRNKMTVQDRRRFEEGYLVAACKREKVEFAALARAAGPEWLIDRPAPVEPNKTPWFGPLLTFFRLLQPRIWIPLAAGLAIVASLTFLINRQGSPEISSAPPSNAGMTSPVPSGPSMISVSLSPSTTTRGAADEVKTVETDAATEAIELKLKVTGEKYSRYQGRLQKLDEGGKEILRDDSLKPAREGAEQIVRWKLEAIQLNVGDYQVELQGVKTTGDLGDTSTYGFNLRTR